jgi:hypothetical protein
VIQWLNRSRLYAGELDSAAVVMELRYPLATAAETGVGRFPRLITSKFDGYETISTELVWQGKTCHNAQRRAPP